MRVIFALAVVTALAACSSTPDSGRDPDSGRSYAPLLHPFKGARLFHDKETAAAQWARADGNPAWLEPITGTPQAVWLTGPQDLDRLPALAADAQAQRALLVLVAYYVPDRDCTDFKQGAPDAGAYLAWIDRLIARLSGGSAKAAIVFEPDAVPADCFNPERAALMREAVRRLAHAGHHVYIDAGHPRWRPPGETAERLIAAGIQAAQGFTVNVANRQTTADSVAWAREVSGLTGDREFLIDTSRNGLGPPPGDEWCNPAHQALGDRPTTETDTGAAALLWIKRPGESDGACGGESTSGFAPRQAARLVANAGWVPENIRNEAKGAG